MTALDIAAMVHSRALIVDLLRNGALPDRNLVACAESPDLLATHLHLGALGGCKACYLKLRGWPDASFNTSCWCGGELYRAKRSLDTARTLLFLGAPVSAPHVAPCHRWGDLHKDVLECILLRSGITLPRCTYPVDVSASERAGSSSATLLSRDTSQSSVSEPQ